MRHIVLFEPDPSGHRMIFVRYIVEAMARRGSMRATLVTTRRGQMALWSVANDQVRRHCSPFVIDEPPPSRRLLRLPPKLERQFGHTRILQSAVRALRARACVDHVFVPFADDYCLFPFAVKAQPFGDIPWSGIAIRPRFHLARAGAKVPARTEDVIEAWAYRRLLRDRSLATLFSIDPYFPAAFADPRVTAVCDPADIATQPPDATWLPVAAETVVLLVYGYIDHRKAIDRLLSAVADPRMPTSLVVALVGVQDPGMGAVLQGPTAQSLRAQRRLIDVDRRVDDMEEASAFARADIVWCYYPGSYCSSGAMVRAGQTGRPLMATDEGLVGLLTRDQGSGLTAPEMDHEALLRQLARLAINPALRGELGKAGMHHFGGDTGVAFGDRIVNRLAGGPDGASKGQA